MDYVCATFRALFDHADGAGLFGTIDAATRAGWRRTLAAHSTRVGLTQDLSAAREDLVGIVYALR